MTGVSVAARRVDAGIAEESPNSVVRMSGHAAEFIVLIPATIALGRQGSLSRRREGEFVMWVS
jgi:hypothetical protein